MQNASVLSVAFVFKCFHLVLVLITLNILVTMVALDFTLNLVLLVEHAMLLFHYVHVCYFSHRVLLAAQNCNLLAMVLQLTSQVNHDRLKRFGMASQSEVVFRLSKLIQDLLRLRLVV